MNFQKAKPVKALKQPHARVKFNPVILAQLLPQFTPQVLQT